MKLKDIRHLIAGWDDNLTIKCLIRKIQYITPVNQFHGVLCWNCGTENRKSNKSCIKCLEHLD